MPEDKITELIFQDKPLDALRLARKLGRKELIDKLETKLGHYYHYEKYLDKYARGTMEFRPDVQILFDAPRMYNRYVWVLSSISQDHARSFLDAGCYEGALVFTAIKGYDIDAYGVELNMEAVKHNNEIANDNGLGIRFYQSTIEDFNPNRTYDAVSCNEVLEHVPNPRKLIDKLKDLSDNWVYITTPNGCYDPEATKHVWETDGAMLDHLWAFTHKDIKELLDGYEIEFTPNSDRLLTFRYR